MQLIRRIASVTPHWAAQDTTLGSGRVTYREHPDITDEAPVVHASIHTPQRTGTKSSQQGALPPQHDPRVELVRRQCLKLAMTIFNRSQNRARSLGFTSAIAGEGKTLLASTTAVAIANDARRPVTLIDCNWESPTLHTMFNLPDSPGLAEWLRDECELEQIRIEVAPNLIVIPAGSAFGDDLELTNKLATIGVSNLLADTAEVAIVDMPSVLTSAATSQLAQTLDAVALVVRAGVTWDSYIAEARHELADAPVEGIILNATKSRIPRWLQRIL